MVFFGHVVDLFIAFLTWIGLLNPNPVDTVIVIPTTPIEPSLVDTTWPPNWQEILLETEPIANLETCFITHSDGKAYLLGGLVDSNTCAYDAATQTWDNSLAPPPVRLTHMQCLSIGDSIWIPTAWTGPSNEFADNTEFIYLYHPANDTWTTKPGLPPDRRRGSAAAVYRPEARQIHVSHGNRGGHGEHSTAHGWHDVFDLDSEAWSVRPDAPHPRDHAGGALLQNGAVFCVAGGRNSGYRGFWWWERYEDAVVLPTDCYDFATETWSVRAEIPTGRAGSAYGLTCDGTQLVVAGGEGFDQAWFEVEAFDGETWTRLPDLKRARHGTGMAVSCGEGGVLCDDQIHVAAGASDQGGTDYAFGSTETLFPHGQNILCMAEEEERLSSR